MSTSQERVAILKELEKLKELNQSYSKKIHDLSNYLYYLNIVVNVQTDKRCYDYQFYVKSQLNQIVKNILIYDNGRDYFLDRNRILQQKIRHYRKRFLIEIKRKIMSNLFLLV